MIMIASVSSVCGGRNKHPYHSLPIIIVVNDTGPLRTRTLVFCCVVTRPFSAVFHIYSSASRRTPICFVTACPLAMETIIPYLTDLNIIELCVSAKKRSSRHMKPEFSEEPLIRNTVQGMQDSLGTSAEGGQAEVYPRKYDFEVRLCTVHVHKYPFQHSASSEPGAGGAGSVVLYRWGSTTPGCLSLCVLRVPFDHPDEPSHLQNVRVRNPCRPSNLLQLTLCCHQKPPCCWGRPDCC